MKSKNKQPEFNPPKFQCTKCGDIIWSRTEGEYVACSCGSTAVDYTRYYGRQIGSSLLKQVEDQKIIDCQKLKITV